MKRYLLKIYNGDSVVSECPYSSWKSVVKRVVAEEQVTGLAEGEIKENLDDDGFWHSDKTGVLYAVEDLFED